MPRKLWNNNKITMGVFQAEYIIEGHGLIRVRYYKYNTRTHSKSEIGQSHTKNVRSARRAARAWAEGGAIPESAIIIPGWEVKNYRWERINPQE